LAQDRNAQCTNARATGIALYIARFTLDGVCRSRAYVDAGAGIHRLASTPLGLPGAGGSILAAFTKPTYAPRMAREPGWPAC